MASRMKPLRVFFSYRHGSSERMKRVLALCDSLRAIGVDCRLDQYEIFPDEGWLQWERRMMQEADLVLLALSPGRMSPIVFDEYWVGWAMPPEELEAVVADGKVLTVVFDSEDVVPLYEVERAPVDLSADDGEEQLLELIKGYCLRHGLLYFGGKVNLPGDALQALPRLQDFSDNLSLEKLNAAPGPPAPWFTGREQELALARARLEITGSVVFAPPEDSGRAGRLGGMGLGQLLRAYVAVDSDQFTAVLWARADCRAHWDDDVARLAGALVPEGGGLSGYEALLHWLENHSGWLLCLDDVELVVEAQRLMPLVESGRGKILMSSRNTETSMFPGCDMIEVSGLPVKYATRMLQQRTQRRALSKAEQIAAEELSDKLYGLPLALEVVAADILEHRGTFEDFYEHFAHTLDARLQEGGGVGSLQESLNALWIALQERIEGQAPGAVDLVRTSAMFYQDALPWEVLEAVAYVLQSESGEHVGALAELLAPFEARSMIRVDEERGLVRLHRVFRETIHAELVAGESERLAQKAVRATELVFRQVKAGDEYALARLAPIALDSALMAKDWSLGGKELGRLCMLAGGYYFQAESFDRAETLCLLAVSRLEQAFGAEHPAVASCCENLAVLMERLDRFLEAEEYAGRAYGIRAACLGDEHPATRQSLDDLERIQRILTEMSPPPGAERDDATGEDLGGSADERGENIDDEQNDILEAGRGDESDDVPSFPDDRPQDEGAPEEVGSEISDQEEIKSGEVSQVVSSSRVEQSPVDLDTHPEAPTLRAVEEQDAHPGVDGPGRSEEKRSPLFELSERNDTRDAASGPVKKEGLLHKAAKLFFGHDKGDDSVTDDERAPRGVDLESRASESKDSSLPETAPLDIHHGDSEAKPDNGHKGDAHLSFPASIEECETLALQYRREGRDDDALPVLLHGLKLKERTYGERHSEVASTLNTLGELYRGLSMGQEAEACHRRALHIRESCCGENHRETAQSLNNLAALLRRERRYAESETLYLRALAIDEALFGDTHPDTGTDYNNIAVLYYSQKRYHEALKYIDKAIQIRTRCFGGEHPLLKQSEENKVLILKMIQDE